MIRNFRLYTILGAFMMMLMSMNIKAQLKPGELVDGVAAVVGDQMILNSDIDEGIAGAAQQGMKVDNRCDMLENIMQSKLILYYAKKDTLIPDRTKELRADAERRFGQMLTGFPSEKDMLAAYHFRTAYELKNEIERINVEQYYQGQMISEITKGVDVTPSEVTAFYNQYKDQLPQVNNEVQLSRIVMYPKLTDAHKQELIDKLKQIRADILAGKTTFEKAAMIYSEDPGSASNGGLIENIQKGMMVKPFEAAAMNLEEGQISEPVETEFGYHLIELIKRAGKTYSVRHILLLATPNADEIKAAKDEMVKIRKQILDKEITFKDAALKYSDDKTTKFNAGVMTDPNGSDKIERSKLDVTDSYQIAGLHTGDITDPFEVDFTDGNQKKKAIEMIEINNLIDAHTLELATDYERIKDFALQQKRNQIIENWVKSKLPDTFISINDRYSSCGFKTNWGMKSTTAAK